ncbi:MAG: hypothetical protein ACFFA6_17630, partial [Promethearchaeota archaeon]
RDFEYSACTIVVGSLTVRHPRDYAPTFWFAPAEQWFPTSPLFRDAEGNTKYTSAEERNSIYVTLDRDTTKAHATVYYDIYGDDELLVPFPYESDPAECMVYEYWLYFTYDKFVQCGTVVWNRHYHDWEKFFVFIDAEDGRVLGMAGSAHLPINPNNVYTFPSPPEPPYHPLVLVEQGGHATCPDMNSNGVFDSSVDVNECVEGDGSWGIKDLVEQRNEEDRISGHEPESSFRYKLAALSSIEEVVESEFTRQFDFWDNSQERHCSECNIASAVLFLAIRDFVYNYYPYTFILSTVLDYDSASHWVRFFTGLCNSPLWWCWGSGGKPFTLAHMPIEHAWRGQQNDLRTDPRKILPGCYHSETGAERRIRGELADVFSLPECEMPILFGGGGGGSWLKASQDGDSVFLFGYTRVGDEGEIVFDDLKDGTYTFFLDPEGGAPYQQSLHVSEVDTLLGVDGMIYLVPDTTHFTLKIVVYDGYGEPLRGAEVRVFAEPDSLLLPTLTDNLGSAYASLDTSFAYKTRVVYGGYEDSLDGIYGSFSDTVTVIFDAVGVGVKGGEGPVMPSETTLHQSHPNPMNPYTVIRFDLATAEHVELALFDACGRKIRTLVAREMQPGHYAEMWNGLDDAGEPVAPGMYFCRLETSGYKETRKVVLLR